MGKNGNSQVNKKISGVGKRKNSESVIRMNFLHAAGSCVLENTGSPVLAAALTHHSLIVGQKGLTRPHRDIKRTICKGCHGILVPGKTADVNLSGPTKQKKIAILCRICKTRKSFLLEENRNKQKKLEATERKNNLDKVAQTKSCFINELLHELIGEILEMRQKEVHPKKNL